MLYEKLLPVAKGNPAATNPPFNKVALLLHGDGTNGTQNNSFIDSSVPSTYPGGYAVSFDGNGDYLTIPSNSAFAFGTGEFTIEGWVYLAAAGDRGIFQQSDGGYFTSTTSNSVALGINNSGTTWQLYAKNTRTVSTATYTLNTWTHFAVVRSGTTTTFYVNGTSVITLTSDTTNYTGTYFGIGAIYGTSYALSGYISNLRVVKGTALYTSNFTPPTSPLTAITNTSLLTCQSVAIVDNSTNKFRISVFGNSAVVDINNFAKRNLSPFATDAGMWSNYFDGNGDYLTITSSTNNQLGSGDFTIEGWVLFNTISTSWTTFSPSNQYIFDIGSNGTYFGWRADTGGGRWFAGGTGLTNTLSYNQVPTTNTWYHFAITRSGTSFTLFINGVSVATATNSGSVSTSNWNIGNYGGGGNYGVNGYISNFRVVKGTAVYTSNFTPPTAPLTAITNTSLLTCQSSRFIDNSANNFAITPAGNVATNVFSPFSSYTAYSGLAPGGGGWFNGTNDYFSVGSAINLATNDFTVEAWVYKPSYSGGIETIFGSTTSGSFSMGWSNATTFQLSFPYVGYITQITYTTPSNSWFHVAVSKASSVYKVFINGVQIGTSVTNTTSIASGTYTIASLGASQYLSGFISNLRLVIGTAVYTANFTPPTAPLAPIPNTQLLTCQSIYPVDDSPNELVITANGTTYATNPNQITRYGNVAQGTFSPFSLAEGQWSNYFDGSGDYLVTGSSITLSGDFTIEALVNVTSLSANRAIVQIGDDINSTGPLFYISTAGKLKCYAGAAIFTGTATIPTNAWIHVAIVRSGTTAKSYVNGILDVTAPSFTANPTGTVKVGAEWYNGALGAIQMLGYISNVRITTTAVYTANFTPPTSALTAISGTSLLTCQSNRFKDNSSNNFTLTVYGDTKVTAFSPFAPSAAYSASTNGGSAYFDGTGDYLNASITGGRCDFGTGDFTVEGWFYFPVDGIHDMIIMYASGVQKYVFYYYPSPNNVFAFFDNTTSTEISPAWNAYPAKINTWYHVAWVRSSGTFKTYLNGVSIVSATYTTSMATGIDSVRIGKAASRESTASYSSNVRITKGTALYTSNFTPPTAPLTAVTNTSLLLNCTNAGIFDNAGKNDIETVGNAQISTSVKKYGTGSMYFDGTGDYLVLQNNPDLFAFGSGDFTIEFWLYVNSFGSGAWLYDSRPTSTNGAYPLVYVSNLGVLSFYVNSADRITSTITTGSWRHIAVSRSGTSTKMFVNGTQAGSTWTDTTVYLNGTSRPIIGGGTYNLNGYIDDLRVTKGVAVYTSNFTPPTQAFPNV